MTEVNETLLENARKVIARTKADNLMGKVIPEDQMLAFALADALLALVSSRSATARDTGDDA